MLKNLNPSNNEQIFFYLNTNSQKFGGQDEHCWHGYNIEIFYQEVYDLSSPQVFARYTSAYDSTHDTNVA
jgi:hypothetical protein